MIRACTSGFTCSFAVPVFLFIVGMTTCALADEGMWLFNAPPLKQLKKNISSSRRRSGLNISKKPASASTLAGADPSFRRTASSSTNHHVGADTLQKMGSARAQLSAGWFLCEKLRPMRSNLRI